MFDAQSKTISSYLDWWSDAGLTEGVADAPCDWLTAPQQAAPIHAVPPQSTQAGGGVAAPPTQARSQSAPVQAGSAAPTAAPTAAPSAAFTLPETLPDSLAEFDAWAADTADLPGAAWSASRVLPTGPANAPLMIIADCPDGDDLESGQLLSGASGRLLDAMFRAIGMERAGLRLASIALTRPPAGRIDAEAVAPLRRMMLHQIALANPQRILVLGQQTNQLLCETIIAPDGHGQRDINHFGGITTAYAVHHPRLLLERPLLKRAAWVTLKRIKDHG